VLCRKLLHYSFLGLRQMCWHYHPYLLPLQRIPIFLLKSRCQQTTRLKVHHSSPVPSVMHVPHVHLVTKHGCTQSLVLSSNHLFLGRKRSGAYWKELHVTCSLGSACYNSVWLSYCNDWSYSRTRAREDTNALSSHA
jgi:hypothetical protein